MLTSEISREARCWHSSLVGIEWVLGVDVSIRDFALVGLDSLREDLLKVIKRLLLPVKNKDVSLSICLNRASSDQFQLLFSILPTIFKLKNMMYTKCRQGSGIL